MRSRKRFCVIGSQLSIEFKRKKCTLCPRFKVEPMFGLHLRLLPLDGGGWPARHREPLRRGGRGGGVIR
jgi:hypothetical protein